MKKHDLDLAHLVSDSHQTSLFVLWKQTKSHADKMFPATPHINNIPWLLRCNKHASPKRDVFMSKDKQACLQLGDSTFLRCSHLFIYLLYLFSDAVLSHRSLWAQRYGACVRSVSCFILVYIRSCIHIKRDLQQWSPATAGCSAQPPSAIHCFNHMQKYARAHPRVHTVRSVGEERQADISQADMSSQLGG